MTSLDEPDLVIYFIYSKQMYGMHL